MYCINIITILNIVQRIVLAEKGVSFKKQYASKGYTKYDKPKNTNLADHTDPLFVFTKYVHE